MESIIHPSLAIVAILCITFITNSHGDEFSVDLIHRDSPLSPFYNPHETQFQRIQNALRRSTNRLSGQSSRLITDLDGEYLMNISIGTPPVQILGLLDTGSDLIWTQCEPCSKCFTQKGAIFNPASSTTYKTVPCRSNSCASLSLYGASCAGGNDSVCHYGVGYYDRSHSVGDLAVDTLTLGPTSSFPNIIIGCGRDNALFVKTLGSGIVGLGNGPASLIRQIGPSVNWKFSYCLASYDAVSSIDFGRDVSGDGVVSTPLITDPNRPYFYYLRLEAISVGNVRIPFHGSNSDDQNVVIDSGTTITVLPPEFYSKLSSEVEKQIIGAKKVAYPSQVFSLCYEVDPTAVVPRLTVHFLGADVVLPNSNLFYKVSETVACFAFRGKKQESFYGNVAQQNFLVGYDLGKKTVSFKPQICGKK
ncbi:Aspartic proteinase CDR1 [Linum perenne]